MTDQTQFLLNQAAAAIKAGDLVGGRKLLENVLETDPDNESAWLWMSAAVESDDERRHCLQQILRINPDSAQARLGLEKLGPAPGKAEELSEPTPAAPGSEMEAFNNMMADFAAFDAAKAGSGVQASGPDAAAANDTPAFTWPLEPDQRDLAPDKQAAPGSDSEQVDLEALFKSFDAASGEAAAPSSASEKAFEWDFDQPAEGGQPAAPAEQLSGEEALDRFLGVEPPKADVRGFYEDDAKAGKAVPAFTFDEGDEIAAAEGGAHASTGETSGGAAFVSPPLKDTDFSFDIDRITSETPVETQGDSSLLGSQQKAEGLLQLWANPGGKANSVVILRDEFLVLANPDALFIDRIRRRWKRRGEEEVAGRTAKAAIVDPAVQGGRIAVVSRSLCQGQGEAVGERRVRSPDAIRHLALAGSLG
jgi:hypothetical protein